MATTEHIPPDDASEATLQQARLHVLVTDEPGFDPKTLADHVAGDSLDTLFAKEDQRQSLFYDEHATIHPILACPFTDEASIDAILARGELSIDAIALGTPRNPAAADEKNQQAAPVKDTVESQIIKAGANPIVSVRQPRTNGKNDAGLVVVAWRAEVHISRLRIRSINPSIYFSASFKFLPVDSRTKPDAEDEFMAPLVPDSINLLESLRLDPALRKAAPVLTAARLAKILPTHKGSLGGSQVIRNNTRHLLRLVPVISSRARFSRIGASPTQTRVLALVDIDITPHCPEAVSIESIDVVLSDGRAESLAASTQEFPMIQHPRNAVTLGYNLLPNHSSGSSAPPSMVHTLSLLLQATLAGKRLRIAWRHPVDLSPLHARPTIVAPQPPPVSHSRPSTATSTRERSISNPTMTATNHLVTLTVSGPPQVRVHDTLRWNLLVANRSATRTLRIALIPITSTSSLPTETISRAQQQAYAIARRGHRNTLSTSLFRAGVAEAPPVLKPTGVEEQIGLIPLTADIRLAPLLPGQCATAEMRFLVLRAGALKVEAVRIVDLDGEGDGDNWTEGAGVESKGIKDRSWVDVGSKYLPDVLGVTDEGTTDAGEGA